MNALRIARRTASQAGRDGFHCLMLTPRNTSVYLFLGLSLLLCTGTLHLRSKAQELSESEDSKSSAAPGGRIFASSCAGCHGLDGRGGDKAPNIVESGKVRHLPDAQLAAIISNGVSGGGMPAFRTLSTQQVRAVVAYLRALQRNAESRVPPGDATRGKEVFFGKGECSNCHTMSGEGGFLGPDLSGYGSALSAKTIQDEITRSNRIDPASYRSAILTTRGGDRLEGVIRNEDNFSLQLQTTDGNFHLCQKSDLQNLEYPRQSLMPTNYGERLTPAELNDLVSFLMGGSSPPKETRNASAR